MKILIKNPLMIATMDEKKTKIQKGHLIVENNKIKSIGNENIQGTNFDKIIDAENMLVLPGLVNTHHHLFQTLTRNIPLMQNMELFSWLSNHYQVWKGLDNEAFYISAKVGLLELMTSGCTTSSDHLYTFPKNSNGKMIDEEIKAAKELGIRFQATRGSMSLSQKDGGLPPEELVQSEEEIFNDTKRLLSTYHQDYFGSMLKISLAPCSPFSVLKNELKNIAEFAKDNNLMLHTHLAETIDEENFCLEKFGLRPFDYLDSLGWIDKNVWTAHSIHLNDREIKIMGERKMGITHCPTSNMRLGSGIARIKELLSAGVSVSLGVDGSASNDSSNLLLEARMALLLSRMRKEKENWLTAEEVLWMATKGGAKALGREDIGSLEVGKCADLAIFNMNNIAYAGGMSDPLAALLFCQSLSPVEYLIINGEIVINKGKNKEDTDYLIKKQNQISSNAILKAKNSTNINFLKELS